MNKKVIVFDIDGILCWHPNCYKEQDSISKEMLCQLHPECPIISVVINDNSPMVHVFIPYLDVIIKYLINNGCRIVFFSAGSQPRNTALINKLLTQLFGEQAYNSWVKKGQFKIFSAEDMRESLYIVEENDTGFVKDLDVVLDVYDTIDNTILIDDQIGFATYEQKFCVVGLPLYNIFAANDSNYFSKNAAYYLLGIFISYFNQQPLTTGELASLRSWLKDFLYSKADLNRFELGCYVPHKYDRFVKDMINLGLPEVQKIYPEAIFYDLDSLQSDLACSDLTTNPKLKIGV